MVTKEERQRQRRQQAIYIAGIYGALLLATLVFRPQAGLFGLLHLLFAVWFGYLYLSKQVLGFLLYSLASVLALIGIVLGGVYFGVSWFSAAMLTCFGLLNTMNKSRTKNIL